MTDTTIVTFELSIEVEHEQLEEDVTPDDPVEEAKQILHTAPAYDGIDEYHINNELKHVRTCPEWVETLLTETRSQAGVIIEHDWEPRDAVQGAVDNVTDDSSWHSDHPDCLERQDVYNAIWRALGGIDQDLPDPYDEWEFELHSDGSLDIDPCPSCGNNSLFNVVHKSAGQYAQIADDEYDGRLDWDDKSSESAEFIRCGGCGTVLYDEEDDGDDE